MTSHSIQREKCLQALALWFLLRPTASYHAPSSNSCCSKNLSAPQRCWAHWQFKRHCPHCYNNCPVMSSALLFIWLLLFFPQILTVINLERASLIILPKGGKLSPSFLIKSYYFLPYSTQHSWKIRNSFTWGLLKCICHRS